MLCTVLAPQRQEPVRCKWQGYTYGLGDTACLCFVCWHMAPQPFLLVNGLMGSNCLVRCWLTLPKHQRIRLDVVLFVFS